MTQRKKTILGVLYGTELFGRERENIECYKTLQSLGWRVRVFGSYREPEGGAVGRELSRNGLMEGVLPFGSHFALSYSATSKDTPDAKFNAFKNAPKSSESTLRHINPMPLSWEATLNSYICGRHCSEIASLLSTAWEMAPFGTPDSIASP